ncbi:rRNA (guanine-N(2)-)-methyltransferase [Treponema brennaborense DSM 12168]|uniref:rRNA (Guanine-N(2)-)-methyltransferase n=2 Tax=Treponema TaxID=157 RepID=F4LMV3_TREBD|nr:rRNA (guanine-N(2)-)-methyltransferase [Treponema brennaborense DSM 12168]
MTLTALCAIGAEKILGNEIKQLGYTLKDTGAGTPGRVAFNADEDALFRANLCLRTADRVYLQLASFRAEDFGALFDGVYAVNWQDFFKKDVKVVVDKVRTRGSKLSSEHSVQGIVHKAIYTKLGDLWHIRTMPETGAESDVRVYIENDAVTVLLDLSGVPLHRRGYRTDGGTAPIRETLAAALLQLMCWRRKTPLHDAFCGSGTIACEAMLYAYNVAPGFGRRFALENLSIYDAARAAEIRRQEAAKIRPDCEARITGTDVDGAAVERSRANAEHAGVTAGRALQIVGSDARIRRPDFEQADFRELAAPYESGLLLGNPPYGERLGDAAQAEALYRDMAMLFQSFPGWNMGFITSHEHFEAAIGKRADARKMLKSGNLDTCFYMYTGLSGGAHGDRS